MGLISNEQLKRELDKYIPGCSSLNVISAFVSMPAVKWLNSIVCENGTKVCIVGRFSPMDFANGASDFESLRQCLRQGHTVKALPNLHAKIYQIDSEIIFTGSANMTGRGLSLVEASNLESCARVEPTGDTKHFISRIVDIASIITLNTLDQMELYLDKSSSENQKKPLTDWPKDILPKPQSIFVSDFPLCEPGQANEVYLANPALEFAAIEYNRSNSYVAKNLFRSSKAYTWLVSHLHEIEKDRGLGFGKVSSLLHRDLADDPAPYRQEVKELVANLYKYIELYASEEVLVHVPGRKSQVVTLL
ncbi:hypothetical protein IOQ59_10945 [Pontibacterium sp. N1Y112]|uniref:PLD phosphodiesterase domain-containing protein n=1 Tax=Pontibacterium sinense TaxID=2781979 RepID=A0A8J7FE58_9GAMM|nr:phospholipase D-like domain-containing protein [Pontibacterium sinense]MBE9397774.1 hypothetical protein [Pontibacterium sinense]